MESRQMRLPSGEAFRHQGLLTTTALTANVRGAFVITLEADDADHQADIEFEAEIGILGLSVDGGHVPNFSHLDS